MKQIGDDAIVSFLVVIPGLLGGHTIRRVLMSIILTNIRLVRDPVQVLVQTVQEECHQLLAVLLHVTRELGCTPAQH